jgi:hypothetical protein
MGRMGEKRKRGYPFFSYALLPPIRPILPLLPVLALKKSRAMLRCQIKRRKKTDPQEPYILFKKDVIDPLLSSRAINYLFLRMVSFKLTLEIGLN